MIIHVSSAEQFKEVTKKGKVLVDFYADWCGPCKMQAPVLDELDKKSKVTIAKVNVDELSDLAEQFGVRSIPTLMVFKDGKTLKQEPGYKALGPLEKFIG